MFSSAVVRGCGMLPQYNILVMLATSDSRLGTVDTGGTVHDQNITVILSAGRPVST